jgi:hypothetical protein
MNIIYILLGLFLAAMGLWGVASTLRCKQPVDALCVDSVALNNQALKTYAAVFAYTFEGVEYRQPSFQSFARQKLQRMFRLQEHYRVYIDPQNPTRVAVTRMPQTIQWMLVVLGVLMIAGGLGI